MLRRNAWVEDFRTQLHKSRVCVLLMRLHQSGVSDYVGCKDSRAAASNFRQGAALLLHCVQYNDSSWRNHCTWGEKNHNLNRPGFAGGCFV
jgi:hypothetical protein